MDCKSLDQNYLYLTYLCFLLGLSNEDPDDEILWSTVC